MNLLLKESQISRELYDGFIELVWVAILSRKELMYRPGAISGMPKGT